MKCIKMPLLGLAALALCGCATISSTQWGSPQADVAVGLAVDSAGYSYALYDVPRTSLNIKVIDPSGNQVRTILVFAGDVTVGSIAVNRNIGNIYVAFTVLGGGTFLRRLDLNGNVLSTTTLTANYASHMAIDSTGTVFVGGQRIGADTAPAISSFTPDGVFKETRPISQVGGAITELSAMTVAPNDMVIGAGSTFGSNRLYIVRFRPGSLMGVAVWEDGPTGVRNFPVAVAADAENRIAVVGLRRYVAGADDAFVSRLSGLAHLGTTLLGAPELNNATGVGFDPHGDMFVSGTTDSWDMYVHHVKWADGSINFTTKWGSPQSDWAEHAVSSPNGKGYVLGGTLGNMGAPPAGSSDVVLSILTPAQ